MRLKLLELKAFGPFTEQILIFDSSTPGLHIIYGDNEAGKSSALRGLKALLYGFHSQTPDNFVHPYDQLLVSGCLERDDGRELCFQRRKRRIGDLLDGDGNPLEAATLEPFLQGVEPEFFESLYGIDHRQLVEGGIEILSQKGEVGQTLFAAGAGLSSLKKVVDKFEQEAADLFKPTGQLPLINKAVKRFKELKKEVGVASLSSKDWRDLKDALNEAKFRRSTLEKERDEKNSMLRRLERLEQAIPELATLHVERERLRELGEVTLLPSDFSERYRLLDELVRESKNQLQKTSEKLGQLEEKRRSISLNVTLLDHGELVDDFHQRLGEYRKGQKDKPERNGMRISLRQEAAQLMKQVRPDLGLEDVDSLRPVLARKKTIQTLSGRFEAINHQLRQAENQSEIAELEMREVKQTLAGLEEIQNSQELEQAVRLAHRTGDLDTLIVEHRDRVERSAAECRAELQRIGLWSGELAELPQLFLPLHETVHQFEQHFSTIIDKRKNLDKERRQDVEELKALQAEINRIILLRKLPSENDLTRIRRQRDEGWQLIRRQWLNGEDVTEESRAFDQERSLPVAYEGLVRNADLMADRLRNEADRVANMANLCSQIEALEQALAGYDRLEDELIGQEKELTSTWAELWEPVSITPLSPKEMSEWLTAIDRLRYRVNELMKNKEDLAREERQRAQLCDNLRQGIKAADEDDGPDSSELGPLLVFAETLLEKMESQRSRLQQMRDRQGQADKKLQQAQQELADAQQLRTDWQVQWKNAVSGLGLEEDISPPEAHDYLDNLQNCLVKVREADELQKRIDGIDRDAADFGREVRDLLRRVESEKAALPLDQAVLHLRTSLEQARNDQTRHKQLQEDIEDLRADQANLRKSLEDGDEQMAELLKTAGCAHPVELPEIIDRFVQFQQIQERIEAIEGILARIGGGATEVELTAQAAAVDADELPGQISKMQKDIEANLNPEIVQISQDIGEINSRLKDMDGSARAADAREKMEQELTGLRTLAEQYFKVKLASRILQQEIERYREEHQGPVLKIASGYFVELTLNSFSELKVDIDERGGPILVGIRPDGRSIKVDGMSDGTRDQLYLALRLATLEWRLKKSESIPFIVDDILVNFDDDRSRAALSALSGLSRQNQVILFTHHQKIVELAETVGNTSEIIIHRLPD
ncbi:MAG: AAA family ATPase [Desulfofustis sp.]|nr:AAA family ATPase [Desulfofustis sp.]